MVDSTASVSSRPVIAIAGATGFVGQAVIAALADDYHIIGLTRSPTRAAMKDDSGVEWRHCDLFSVAAVERALDGVDFAFYLVHSMLPSARLTQANFVDLDLLLADNFARAAEANGVQQILYIGGILPENDKPSTHLRSRFEVETTLAGRRTPLTSLRAGLIVGPGGSSFAMLVHLVRRLPAMVLPAWTGGASCPVAIQDVVRAVRYCIGRVETYGQTYEIGGPEVMTYRQLLVRTARHLELRRPMVGVSLVSPGFSKLWVSTITGASTELVGPLIESLRHSLVPRDNALQEWLRRDALSFEQALSLSVDDQGRLLPNPRDLIKVKDAQKLRVMKTVRSVQRLPLPPGRRAEWVAVEYMRWLPSFMWPILTCDVTEGRLVRFCLRFPRLCLLELSYAPERSQPDRQLFRITGGWLARVDSDSNIGRLEFREVLSRTAIIAAIHDFRPALPWYVYNLTQALAHLYVMRGFGRHLARVTTPELPASTEAVSRD